MTLYASVRSVRRMLGRLPDFLDGIRLGEGDGTRTKFFFRNRYIVDGNGDGIIDSNDVTVYVEGEEAEIDHIDAEGGFVVLSAAPSLDSKVTADYYKSDLPDWEIEEEIKNFSKLIEDKTQNTFATDTLYTQTWNGDGVTKEFFFERTPVYEIVSYNIDDDTSGYTENEDYYLFPKSERAIYITFDKAPLKDKKNISITYYYGEDNEKVNRWVRLNVMRNLIRFVSLKSGDVGVYVPPEKSSVIISPDRSVSLQLQLYNEIRTLEQEIGGLIKIEVLDDDNS